MTSRPIDLDIVDQVIALVPENAWPQVKEAIVTAIVDEMPGSVLEQLTGSPDDFDRAEEILTLHYEIPDFNQELIVDAFKILGQFNALELLSSLNLTKE